MINDVIFDEGGAVFNVMSQEFGAKGTGDVDDAPAINAALAAARKASQFAPPGTRQGTIVYLPPGTYRIDESLNCTNGQYNLVGSGAFQTILLGNTGSLPVIDMSGASYSSVRDLLIDSEDAGAPNGLPAVPTPSSLGILCSRITGLKPVPGVPVAPPYYATQPVEAPGSAASSLAQVNLDGVNVRLASTSPTDPNSGSVAVYNFGVEEVNYHNVQLRADTPLVICATNVFDFVSPYAWLPTLQQSMTVVNVTGQSSLVCKGLSAVRLHGGANTSIDAFLSYENVNDPSSGQYAILSTALWTDFRWRGDMEGFATLLRIDNAEMNGAELQGYASYTAGKAMISLTGNAQLQGGILRVTPTPSPNEGVGGSLLVADGTGGQFVQNVLMYLFTNAISCTNTQFQGNVVISLFSLAELLQNVQITGGKSTGNVLMGWDMTSVNGVAIAGVGPTADRPAAGAGAMYYDTTLGHPVWSNGTDWKNALGL